MLSRFAPRAKTAVVDTTQTEARRLHHREVGTDDLLLAIVKDPEGFAAKAVVAQGVAIRQLRQAIPAAPAAGWEPPERIPYSSRAKKALSVAVRHALRLGHNYVGTEHLLLAILDDADGEGAQALLAVGIDPPAITTWLERELAAAAARRR
jgi:ATP-dependent Clp protease ATP-binding subunit ClpA